MEKQNNKKTNNMSMNDPRVAFTLLRLEYYISGRILYFHSSINSGCIILGYAIESYLKSALYEINHPNKRLRMSSHDLPKLLQECQKAGLFKSIKVSSEFIEYASDQFNQRYPIQQQKIFKKVRKNNRMLIKNIGYITAYDDLICQLDDELYKLTKDVFISIGIRASAQADSYQGRSFFHCNAYALKRINYYKEIIKKVRPSNISAIKELEKGPEYLWNFPEIGTGIGPDWRTIVKKNHALTFKYPKEEFHIDKNGKKYMEIKLI